MTRLGWLVGGAPALLQLVSGAPSPPGTTVRRLGFSARASGLSCSTWVGVGPCAPEFGTLRPCDGSTGYNWACSIQFSHTTNGYWSLLTGQVAATQIRQAVSSIEELISFGAAQGFCCESFAPAAWAPGVPDPKIAIVSETAAAIATVTRVISCSPYYGLGGKPLTRLSAATRRCARKQMPPGGARKPHDV